MSDIADIAADIEASKTKVRELQAETIHTITIKPSGKVEVVDKEKLESLNSEVDRLNDLVEHNSSVHETLFKLLTEADCLKNLRGRKNSLLEPTVQLAGEQKGRLEKAIADTENRFRIDIGNLIESTHGIDPVNPFDHPKAKALKETADIRLASLHSELSTVAALLARAEAILQDFQPSGVTITKPDEFRHAITRESAAAFGA
ncbi:MAG: hypothetical protein QG575_1661 [Euryarchaeota archaeon]|nr:hypothetical protein [Euryarchaeota archaeon]